MTLAICSLLLAAYTLTLVSGSTTNSYAQHDINNLDLFSGLDAVINYFRNHSDPLAQQILFTFERDCFYMADPGRPPDDDPNRKAFIVIEGNYRSSRDTVALRLARMMDGRYLNNPAPCLIRFLQQLPAATPLRRAFYILSLYATDFNVRVQLNGGRTVVLNGYWMDQLTFTMVQLYGDRLPSASSPVFKWPPDLLQPDITFYLTLPDGVAPQRVIHKRTMSPWQSRSLQLYRSMQMLYPIVIEDFKVHADTIYQHILKGISHKRDVKITDLPDESSYAMFLFSGLEGVLDYLRNCTNSPLAQRILETWEKDCQYGSVPEIPSDSSRKPFIVVEGNGHTSRDIVGKGLARRLNARYMVHPASCLVKFMDILPKGTVLRRAYYVLSLYAASNNIRAHLSTNRAIVLNGYWLDQLTFSLIQSHTSELPEATDDLFKLPGELLRPDLVVYLHLSDQLRSIDPETDRPATSWFMKSLQIYEKLKAVYPIVIHNLKGDDRATTTEVYRDIQQRLSDTRHIVKQDYEEVSDVMKLFTGLDAVLSYFRNSTSPLAKEILDSFEQQQKNRKDSSTKPRNPFIVIEGNNRTSRDLVGLRLARIMSGISLKHPAPCLRPLMAALPRSSLMRRAYYILSLYATSIDVREHLINTPVLLNGYWFDQLTFAMIQSFPYGRLPAVASSPIYRWPEGLLQPDLVVYLNHPDDLSRNSPLTRSHRNWKPRALDLYEQLTNMYNIKIQDLKSLDYWKTTDEIYQYIRQQHTA